MKTDSPAAPASEQIPASEQRPSAGKRRPAFRKAFVFAIVAAAAATGYWQFGEALSLESLAAREAELRVAKAEAVLVALAVGFVVYVAVTGLSLPGAAVLTLASGWFFGVWQGTLLVSFASTTGATLAFLFSRYLFRDAMRQRFGGRLAGFNEALEREGPFYLFTLRMIPAVPFFVINLVMGLTPIRTRTFWWVSQLGMLPGTAAYCYAGAAVPSLGTLAEEGLGGILSAKTLVAFAILGAFPIVVKKTMAWARARRSST